MNRISARRLGLSFHQFFVTSMHKRMKLGFKINLEYKFVEFFLKQCVFRIFFAGTAKIFAPQLIFDQTCPVLKFDLR